MLCATMAQYLPTIYALNDPYPLASFSGPAVALGDTSQKGYRNTCTMKVCPSIFDPVREYIANVRYG